LRPVAANVRLKQTTLPQLCRMPLSAALDFLRRLKLTKAEKQIAGDLRNEAVHRLDFLVGVGLEYLTLDRSMPTLSGGESQRIRLAGQVGRSLTGVLYVLDEPTIGLHPRDNGRLLSALQRLRDLGNTVLLVEHDREVLQAADRLFDFGPGAGRLGGSVVAEGTPKQIANKRSGSLTGSYLSGRESIPVPTARRIAGNDSPTSPAAKSRSRADNGDQSSEPLAASEQWLELLGASHHNLRNTDLRIPLSTLTCITGVSGSGKSSLVMNTLAPAVARRLNLTTVAPGPFRELRGVEHLSKIVIVDQNPIGNTPASNPATYTGVFDHIRELFCRMPEAKVRGFTAGRFSFNRAGGRCDDCEGMGQQKIEMHFLPDVWVECPTCRGKRYNTETLTVRFSGFSIADVLDMPVEKALEVFTNVPKIRAPLATLNAIGLGYLTLGQSAPTLSGGEAQRIKLAAELARPNSGRTLYLLDEPTTGLHFDDIAKLLAVLNGLVNQGNTVVVIEHNLDVVKTADWIVDLGPEAGAGGGCIVVQGTPEAVVRYAADASSTRGSGKPRSWTGELLGPVLAESRAGDLTVFDVEVVSKKQDGDVSVEQLGKSAKLPWESDGQRWHLQECLSHNGQRCRWDSAALKFVIDTITADKRFQPANWNHRSTVEVKAKDGLGWLLHARTGHEWMLVLCFRVRQGTFDAAGLTASLQLTPIDDIEEVHYYSQSDRITVKKIRGPWQEISIKVWKQQEIDTPAFRAFLQQAMDAHAGLALKESDNPEDLMPWKKLGRKWHLLQRGLPKKGRRTWDFSVTEPLLKMLEQSFEKGCDPDYAMRSKINWKRRSDGLPVAELHTKRSEGPELLLFVAPGQITIGQIAAFGCRQHIQHRNGMDVVRIGFSQPDQVTNQFRAWLQPAGE
ncbi:MAG: excinuclease ABC subunit A, partial [Planctomycetaceae bacterium]|nr:excinuclease ABC subunit A [Planctomycetaceae bacterium]